MNSLLGKMVKSPCQSTIQYVQVAFFFLLFTAYAPLYYNVVILEEYLFSGLK